MTTRLPGARAHDAKAVVLIVVAATEGWLLLPGAEDVILDLPAVLRSLADQIEADAFKGQG